MWNRVLTLALAAMAVGCGAPPASDGYTGRMISANGSGVVLAERLTTVQGDCTGWNALEMYGPDASKPPIDDLLCWRRVGEMIEVTTAQGDQRRSDPAALFKD